MSTPNIPEEVRLAIEAHPDKVQEYRNGKPQSLGYLVGLIMKTTSGRADPGEVQRELRRQLFNG